MTTQQLWQAALGELELLLSKANFTTWFKNTSVSDYNHEEVVIAVPNGFTKEWLEKKYHQLIIKALRNVSEKPIKRIIYKIEAVNLNNQQSTPQPQLLTITREDVVINNPTTNPNKPSGSNLNQRYVFDHFIVGANNELAHAAAQMAAKNPGSTYNPLFIYGGVGLGKTHLMQAIGNYILQTNQGLKILYISGEKFTNDFINSVQSGKINEFDQKYQNIDVLLVDDVQFIANKERTTEKFFHTFNDLYQQNKQIVLTSDRPPKAIANLEHRLVSRFECGMTADISAPDLETKIAIINVKLQEKNHTLSQEVVNYLATVIHNNVRELEGAINRIIAHSQLQNKNLNLDDVKGIVSSLTADTQKKSATPKSVINMVAEYFDIKIDDIIGPCRKKNLTEPRQIIMYLIREELKSSYPVIGQELGGRDHTTVMHACHKIEKNIKSDDKLRHDLIVLKQKLYTT